MKEEQRILEERTLEERIAEDHDSEEYVAEDHAAEAHIVEESVDRIAGEACMICNQHQIDGLHICGEFICVDCEREMINTDVRDAKYPFFIHQMKQVWQRKNA